MQSSELTAFDPLEVRMLDALEAQLIARFSPQLPPEEVHSCLLSCAACYESARVRSYLPVLIERDATRLLRGMSGSPRETRRSP